MTFVFILIYILNIIKKEKQKIMKLESLYKNKNQDLNQQKKIIGKTPQNLNFVLVKETTFQKKLKLGKFHFK